MYAVYLYGVSERAERIGVWGILSRIGIGKSTF